MAKINISFNNKTYEIDESALSEATTDLQSHLSTTMNGTGATINLGGTAYNIDSTKLSTATNDFVSHLGTIAGNGYKVVIGGVEYNIDSTKMGGAITAFETALNDLQSVGAETEPITYLYNGVELPDINEVWTDKETYSYALIDIVNRLYLIPDLTLVSFVEAGSDDDYSSVHMYNTCRYTLNELGDGWNGEPSSTGNFALTLPMVVWANFLVKDVDVPYLYPSDPVPVGE